MRRKDRMISDKNEMLEIMKKCDSCSVAFYDEEYPYIVPLNFGVELIDEIFVLYFHGANVGTKIELLKANNHVAFEMSCSHKLILEDIACRSTMEYESICGNGIMTMIEEEEKIQGLNALMNQFQNDKKHEFDEKEVSAVAVLKLEVNDIVGKRLKRN